MSAKARLSERECAEICTKYKCGRSAKEIAMEHKCTEKTVRNIWFRYEETGEYETRPMKQREYLISDSDAEYVVVLLKRHHDLKFDDIRAAIKSSASDETIKRAVGRVSGIYWAVEPKIQHTDPKTQAKRVAWAREHHHWTTEQRNMVLWTDEKRFLLHPHLRDAKPYFPDGTPLHPVAGGGEEAGPRSSCNFWGAFSGEGIGDVVLIADHYKSPAFLHLIAEESALFEDMGPGYSVMMDNAPIHKTKIVQHWLQSHQISIMDFPPHSSDLNPIKDLWAIVQKRARRRKYSTPAELEGVVKAEWERTKAEIWPHLVAGMQRRCEMVIEAKGFPI
jgi:transposase